ncbi:hypothetical protein ACFPK9_03090 [Rubritalea spongiae]|uniref:Uncharacterized protein n=1 Tax=Rubritalea spongiae TaxID=430797 RepID=A0ABW5E346_9BACT
MATHTVLSWIPRNLQSVDSAQVSEETQFVDLKERLRKAVEESYPVEITEAELNQYIEEKLTLTQSPIVDDFVQINGVYVDLLPNLIEITIERTFDYPSNVEDDGSKKLGFLPFTQTVTMQLKVHSELDSDGAVKTMVEFPGGSFGRAPAPGMLVILVKPSYDVLADFFAEELDLGYRQMTYVTVEDGVIKLDPRPLGSEQP